MDENEIRLVIDWLQEIVYNPDGWREFYSDSEVKYLAEKIIELIR